MKVVGDERPGKALGFGLRKQLSEPAEKVIVIGRFAENLAPLYSTCDDVMQGAWSVYPGLAWHVAGYIIAQSASKYGNVKGVPSPSRTIPEKLFLSSGKADERPFVSKILTKGQTGVMDRYYQCHKNFDEWQSEEKHFVCRIRKSTRKTIVEQFEVPEGSHIFLDVLALLGTPNQNQTEKPVRVVGYKVDNKEFYVATDRFDLTAEQVALVYKLRWDVEIFFGWWKQHLKVYHLIARSAHGLMAQILGGLITYLLLAIYCQEEHQEKVSINRVRELRINIRNEHSLLLGKLDNYDDDGLVTELDSRPPHASP